MEGFQPSTPAIHARNAQQSRHHHRIGTYFQERKGLGSIWRTHYISNQGQKEKENAKQAQETNTELRQKRAKKGTRKETEEA
jgi:hypothetical protein